MSLLILEERILPSSVGVDISNSRYLKPIITSLTKSQTVDYDFSYAVEEPLVEKDSDKVTYKKFKDAIDVEKLFEQISKHDVIILMGGFLTKLIVEKSLSKCLNKAQKIGDKIFIPTHSSYHFYTKKVSCIETFTLAINYCNGNILQKDSAQYEIIRSLERLSEVIEYRHITKIFAFDFETTGFDYFNKDQVATILSITFQPGYSYIIPFEHSDNIWGDMFNNMINIVSEMFEDPEVIKVAHNLKFDFHWLTRYNIPLKPRIADTILMSHILDENRRHGLKDLTKLYFPFWSDYEDDVDYHGPLEPLAQYAAIDTDVTLRLYYLFENALRSEESLYRLFRNLVMPATFAFQEMEYFGAKIDRPLILKSIEKAEKLLAIKYKQLNDYPEVSQFIADTNKIKLQEELEKCKNKIEEHISKGRDETYKHIITNRARIAELKTNVEPLYTEVNYKSPKQLVSLMYDGFKFPVQTIQGRKVRSSAKEVLVLIDHPFINTLRAYRTISSMLSTYYRGILDKLDTNDFVHGSFKLNGTVTGRASSSGPNLQNIPSRLSYKDEDAEWCLKQVKKFFIPIDEAHVVLQADYSQAELRVIANVSKDPVMIEAYQNDGDLHINTGAIIRGISVEEFKKLPKKEFDQFRYYAKPANFGWFYKASIAGYIQFAKSTYGLELNEKEALKHKNAIFETYPTIKRWHARTEAIAKKQNYLETMFGRRRRFLNINGNSNEGLINQDIRNAINNPIQGTAGEWTIFCIALLYHRLPEEVKIWCTVHDSVFFYLPKNNLEVINIINETCENPPVDIYFDVDLEEYPVPMKMDYEVSTKSWRDMIEAKGSNIETIIKSINSIIDKE